MLKRLGALAVTSAALLALTAPPAAAHTALEKSDPAAKSSVKSPSAITLTFNQPVRLPKLALSDPAKAKAPTGTPEVDGREVTVPVSGTLANGVHTVAWRVVSADGHPVSGTFKFTVEGSPEATPTGSATAQAAPAPATTEASAEEKDSGGSSGWLWIGLAVLVVVLIGGGVFWARRPSND
ncbi:copper resistance CopC family protein [Spirillospora sp. CA-294931]|uniref:copper resistance CopC family protein n=1 Tax=Spirillospora sp. CA-294931 TaxID=3240042 RepID=UPI003D8FF9D7